MRIRLRGLSGDGEGSGWCEGCGEGEILQIWGRGEQNVEDESLCEQVKEMRKMEEINDTKRLAAVLSGCDRVWLDWGLSLYSVSFPSPGWRKPELRRTSRFSTFTHMLRCWPSYRLARSSYLM